MKIDTGSGQLTIDDVIITDTDIVQFFSTLHDDNSDATLALRFDVLVRSLKIGVAALQRAQTQVDVDMIRLEFTHLRQQFQEILIDIFNPDTGSLNLSLEDYLGDKGKLADLLKVNISGDGSKFKRLLDYTENDSPLQKLFAYFENKFKSLDEHLVELQKQTAEQKGRLEERERGTRQGADFEDLLSSILDQSARIHGDVVSLVGETAMDGGSKKGDILVEINPKATDGRKASIIVEAKRKSMAITGKTGILEEIEMAKNNRSAQFAIAVFSDDCCPPEVGLVRDYGDNRLVCTIPADGSSTLPLEIAYKLARTEVCWQMMHQSDQLDHAKVTQILKQIQEKLAKFQGIKSKATRINELTNTLNEDLDNLERDIKRSLSDALLELSTEAIL